MITRTRRAAVMLAAALLTLPATACTTGGRTQGRTIAAGFYPLAYVAERVAGDQFRIVNLTTPGAEPHDLELGLRQTAVIEDAELVVFEPGLQPAVDESVRVNAKGHVLDVTTVIDLEPLAEEHHDDHEGHDHGHSDEGLDPHFWLDPLRMADLGDAVAERLADLDPAHAADYHRRAARLRADLTALDREFATSLAACRLDSVVVSHDAFGYLGRYGLHFESIAGLSPNAEPSPAQLASLDHLIEDEGVTTVFFERLASPKMAETLAAEAGVSTAVLDPVEGLTDDSAGEDYLTVMRANLAALTKANRC